MIVKYKLNGIPCNPINRNEIYLEISHDQEAIINQPRPHVSINNLYFGREDIATIMAWLNTAPGITEGMPLDIEITEGGVTDTINMYLDLMTGLKRSNDGIYADIKMIQSLDWLENRVDGFTFEALYNDTTIAPFIIDGVSYSSYQNYFDKKTIYIPYVLSTIPNRQDAFMALFSTIYIIVELSKAIKTVLQWAAPMEGLGVVMGVAQLVAEIAFTVLLLAALIVIIEHLFNCLMQPIKYHGGMLMVDMLKIACHKLGLDFQSSIWNTFPYNQIAYLPTKYNPIEEANTPISFFGISFLGFRKTGFQTPGYATSSVHDSSTVSIQKGYFEGTGGDLFRLAKRYCNGKLIIPDATNQLFLERRDFYPAGTPYQLPDIRQDWNGYNTDELMANMEIEFEADLNDKNCISFIDVSGNPFYPGTILQATHSQISTIRQQLVGLKGLRQVNIAAARGVAKDKLNFLEQMQHDLSVAFVSIGNAGQLAIAAAIIVADAAIILIDYYIGLWNLMVGVLVFLVNVMNSIIGVINDIINEVNNLGGSISNISTISIGTNLFITPFPLITFASLNFSTITTVLPSRLDALLLENDMVTTPKLLLVDTARSEFTAPGGFSGQQRIAYLHNQNTSTINAQYVWDKFYYIDAFVGTPNNRFTKIAPALNKPTEKNPVIISLKDFKNMVANPKIHDNFAEPVISDTIQWYIEKNGSALIEFRKAGWLKNPQSNNGIIRSQEIDLNLHLKTSLPNGQ